MSEFPSLEPANPPARRIAGSLLVLSGITHVAQLFVYEHAGHVIGAAAFGVAYFLIGLWLLLSRARAALWFGTVLPTIGGILGVLRFVNLQQNPFSVFHVLLDLIIVPLGIGLLTRRRR